MTNKLFLLSLLVLLTGCEWIAPTTSKALSESKQVKLMERQVVALEEIARALQCKP